METEDTTTNQPYKRRERYKGKYPRNFKEKYKELQPEKYKDTIEKVTKKGNTPAGTHISICVKEILDFLQIKEGEKGLDATLGYGGHTIEMLKALNNKGHLFAFDIDSIEIEKTKKRITNLGYTDDIFSPIVTAYDNEEVINSIGKVDFILADLGLSSMQIDNPDRGLSFKTNGPLDMRMNPLIGVPAHEKLKDFTKSELEGMLIENSDEPYAKEISEEIIKHYKKGNSIETTQDLKEVIEKALINIPFENRKDGVKKSCQRSFQAIRIDINNEYEMLENFLNQLPNLLNENGRVAILTFHSGEDRLVKRAFKNYYKDGIFSEISKDVIRPSKEECFNNPRATSAKLRTAIK